MAQNIKKGKGVMVLKADGEHLFAIANSSSWNVQQSIKQVVRWYSLYVSKGNMLICDESTLNLSERRR